VTGLRLAALVLAGVLLQTSLMPNIRLLGLEPDLLPPLVVAITLLRGAEAGMICGFAAGLGYEIVAPADGLGILSLVLTMVGAATGEVLDRGTPITGLVLVGLGAAATLLTHLGYALILYLVDIRLPAGTILMQDAVPATLAALLIAIPVHAAAKLVGGTPRRTLAPQVPSPAHDGLPTAR
jgi:rod shape-determining protein MreD